MSTTNQNDDATQIGVPEDDATNLVDNTASAGADTETSATPAADNGAATPNVNKDRKKTIATVGKRVGAGAAVGILIGGISTVLMGMDKGEAASAEPTTETATDSAAKPAAAPTSAHQNQVVDGTVQIASTPDTEMSFSEAFAAARAEVGPGGTFEWHGNLYGTYTAEEWDNLSNDEKADFAKRFNWNNIDTAESDVAEFAVSAEVAGNEAPAEAEAEVSVVSAADDDMDDDIEVVSVHHDDAEVEPSNAGDVQDDAVEVVAVEPEAETADLNTEEADVDVVEVETVMAQVDVDADVDVVSAQPNVDVVGDADVAVVSDGTDVDVVVDEIVPELNSFEPDELSDASGDMLASDVLPDYASEDLV